jgi:thioredoxin reductase
MRVLGDQGIAVDRRSIVRLEGPAGRLDRVRFDRGERELDALFFHWGAKPASPVALGAGCACEPDGAIVADPRSLETSVPGIYAAGDIVDRPHLVVSAVAGGVRAALSIHRSLLPPEFEL